MCHIKFNNNSHKSFKNIIYYSHKMKVTRDFIILFKIILIL